VRRWHDPDAGQGLARTNNEEVNGVAGPRVSCSEHAVRRGPCQGLRVYGRRSPSSLTETQQHNKKRKKE